jgi:hypothetical protein
VDVSIARIWTGEKNGHIYVRLADGNEQEFFSREQYDSWVAEHSADTPERSLAAVLSQQKDFTNISAIVGKTIAVDTTAVVKVASIDVLPVKGVVGNG